MVPDQLPLVATPGVRRAHRGGSGKSAAGKRCVGGKLQARVKLNDERGKAAGEKWRKTLQAVSLYRVNLLASGKSWTLHVMNHERYFMLLKTNGTRSRYTQSGGNVGTSKNHSSAPTPSTPLPPKNPAAQPRQRQRGFCAVGKNAARQGLHYGVDGSNRTC